MYTAYFGLKDNPFSLTPDPSYLYLSAQHREALAHLLFGTAENGGFVQLTGEVGTGKTTLIRTLLEQRIENVDVALCLNPRLTVEEFVATICDELHIDYPRASPTLKQLIDALNAHLLHSHAQGRHTLLIIDEAQNLSRNVLEQVRLLTNLETHRHKLLRIILVGQPELQQLLDRQDMRQLAQRITARYHLRPLNRQETAAYIIHRLQVAGGHTDLFTRPALRAAHRLTGGIPRLLNVIGDRALLGSYSEDRKRVNAAMLYHAAHEALRGQTPYRRRAWKLGSLAGVILVSLAALSLYLEPALLSSLTKLPAIVAQNLAALHSIEPSPVAPPPAPEKPIETVSTAPLTEGAIRDLVFTQQPDDDAMQRLAATWEENLSIPPEIIPCEYLKAHTLRCLSGRGSWDELRRYNRPVIVRLTTSRGDTRQVLLRSLNGETVILDVAGQTVQLTRSVLDPLWTGEYLLLWRPPVAVDLMAPGYRGEAVKWLRQRLALADGAPEPQAPLSDFFDVALKEQVQRFQRVNNLQADGLVGMRTLLYLDSLAPAPGTPLLISPVTSKLQ